MAAWSYAAMSDPVVHQKDLDPLIAGHERFARGMRGGLRLNLQFRDASGLNFANRDLREATMVGGRFNAAVFKFAKLAGANFYGATLEMADLSSADLTRSDLRGAILRGRAGPRQLPAQAPAIRRV